MAMYKSLFDLSPEQTASTAMPRTVVFSNGTGSGSMTICPLFLGAELYYNDMHLAFFEEATAPMRNVIEINHCRVGRYECSFGANSCCYLAAGDFAVCAAARKKSSSCFPLRHYHGVIGNEKVLDGGEVGFVGLGRPLVLAAHSWCAPA